MSHFQHFNSNISKVKLPERFTYPFYYTPHPLAVLAVQELQDYLELQSEFNHNFGLKENDTSTPTGKMFGVLVVKNQEGEIGYLAAYSGRLADKSLPDKFVPPIFDLRSENSFYLKGEEELNKINRQIEQLEQDPKLIGYQDEYEAKSLFIKEEITQQKKKTKLAKKDRKIRRLQAEVALSPGEFLLLTKELEQESHNDQFLLKELTGYRQGQLAELSAKLMPYTEKIKALKSLRKTKSTLLQQQVFDRYQFLNKQKKTKALLTIFNSQKDELPPSGAGDCSAPKLLQYAFANDLEPIALAEFWWGKSPKTEIRKHKNYYPACQGRCKPILTHMLEGIKMDENPLIASPSLHKDLDIIYEDDAIIIINKPPELLTVPGKEINDSVQTRMKALYPSATGPLIVHRLDMSTSGILVLTKTKEANKILQSQFIKRIVKKRYVALLDGIIEKEKGEINLPLRVDLNDRPRQMVCYEHGKNAKTQWRVAEIKDGKTKIYFYPITGRTHQLRVHAAHPSGLNMPIVGDDLYGHKANRLHLHAAYISFIHPTTDKKIRFSIDEDF